MTAVKKLYNYPAHGVRVFDRVLKEQAALGRSLLSLSKGYFLGSGVSFRFLFSDAPPSVQYELTYFYGRRREDSDPVFQSWHVSTVLRMRAWWIPIGYFYLLQKTVLGENQARCVECAGVFDVEEMIAHGSYYVCARCKPAFIQRLTEGGLVGDDLRAV
ncbi:MAG: hypothetical protein C5B50_13110 [Verrucomicrobia bacterium]|nr:MAG: hypothetical protein C5B50_13110 [Verrucomicrobiota bacterium]